MRGLGVTMALFSDGPLKNVTHTSPRNPVQFQRWQLRNSQSVSHLMCFMPQTFSQQSVMSKAETSLLLFLFTCRCCSFSNQSFHPHEQWRGKTLYSALLKEVLFPLLASWGIVHGWVYAVGKTNMKDWSVRVRCTQQVRQGWRGKLCSGFNAQTLGMKLHKSSASVWISVWTVSRSGVYHQIAQMCK